MSISKLFRITIFIITSLILFPCAVWGANVSCSETVVNTDKYTTCTVLGDENIRFVTLIMDRDGFVNLNRLYRGSSSSDDYVGTISALVDSSSWIRATYTVTARIDYRSGRSEDVTTEFTLAEVAGYGFEGGLGDSISGNEAVADGDIAYSSGKQGKGLLLNGSGRVNLGDRFDDTDTLSISVWVKFDEQCNDGRYCRIISKHQSGSGVGSKSFIFQRLAEAVGGQLQARFYGNDGYVDVTGTTMLQTGNWYHLAATFHEGLAKLYVNGQQEAISDQKYNIDDQAIDGVVRAIA